MAVRKDWAPLAGILQKALDSISEKERNEIYRKWLPIRYEHGFDYTLFWYTSAIFTLILLGLAAWTRKLLLEIKSRKEAQKALLDSENKFKLIFETANVGKSLTLSTGKINVNQAFCNMLGYTKEELKDKKWQEITPAEDIEATQKHLDPLLQGRGNSARFNKRYIHKNGSYIWADVSVVMHRDSNGQPLFFITTIIDITERKRAEDTLRDSERRLQIFLDSTSDMVFLKDDHYYHLIVNRSLCKFYGKTEEEIIGKTDFDLMTGKETVQCRKSDEQTLLSTALTVTEEVVEDRYYQTMKFPVELAEGKKGIGAYIRDITESKKTEEEVRLLVKEMEQKVIERTKELHNSQLALLNVVDDLNQSAKQTDLINRRLKETNKELAAFSYSVSHDLRAPLRSIDGFSLALLEDYQNKLDDTGKNYLHKIRAATQHMGLLIEDMLKLSRITHVELHHESIDLSKIVKSIADTLQQRNPERNVKMTIREGIIIKGDLNAMQIALTNLLENAWKFTGKQEQSFIEFGVTLTEGQKIFFIRDNGVGFDMTYVNKLFGAFQRLHSTDEFPGTGIGLATVKRIITRHGGQIWAEGEIDKGATFFFTLPE
jgi:PAS domain S-box-containing protein